MTSDQWVDIYEPKSLSEMVGQEDLVKAFQEYVKLKHIPDMTIAGAPGCGKTLLMRCFAHDLGWVKFEDKKQIDIVPGQFFLLNSSDDRGIDVIRTTLKRIASMPTLEGIPRLIVLDEFNLTQEAQAAMRALIEKYSSNSRFTFLSNDPSNIIEPLISRCPLKFAKPLTYENVKTIVERIKKDKQFQITEEALQFLYKITSGDIRKLINMLQDACIVSNFNVQIQHIQNTDVPLETAKAILEVAQTNFEQAKETLLIIYTKTKDAKNILEKMYQATYITKFSEDIESNKIIQMRLRERIAETDYRLTQGVNSLIQLDALLNYIKLIKYLPLTCPKSK